MKRVINDSSIWDLHIHSCKSPKSSGEFQKMCVIDFIDKLLEIFSDDLSLFKIVPFSSPLVKELNFIIVRMKIIKYAVKIAKIMSILLGKLSLLTEFTIFSEN